jgi:hypothetical protein
MTLEGTRNILPCPKITQGMSPTTCELYVQTWLACKWLRQGDMAGAEQCLEIATDAAREIGVPPPCAVAIMRDNWEARMYASLARRDSALGVGLVELGQIFQEEAVQASHRAKIPIPSFGYRCEEEVGLVQSMDTIVRNVLLTSHLIIQSLWRYFLLL